MTPVAKRDYRDGSDAAPSFKAVDQATLQSISVVFELWPDRQSCGQFGDASTDLLDRQGLLLSLRHRLAITAFAVKREVMILHRKTRRSQLT